MIHKVGSGVVGTMRAKQSGFTLIEALIAFLIIVVGLAGAALFQSKLINESGASKAKAVAVMLAEKKLEEKRAAFFADDYSDIDTMVTNSTSEITSAAVGNTEYTVEFTPISTMVSTASAATDAYYQFTAAVNWTDARGDDASVALSTFLSSNDPANSLDETDDAGNGSDSVGSIERPGGSAEAIARVAYDMASSGTNVGGFVAISEGAGTYGVKTEEAACDGDGNCTEKVVSVIRLTGDNADIFQIKGNIYFDPTATAKSIDYETIALSPNVLTSEGGGCAVYQFDGQASYTCLFGTGWYGDISLVFDSEDRYGTACLSPRSYKYYLVDSAIGDIHTDNPVSTASFVGQSGLVRFTDNNGDGPYITDAASYSEPGLGYYYLDRGVNLNTSLGRAGDVYEQNFVVTGDNANSYQQIIENCTLDRNGNLDAYLTASAATVPDTYPSSSKSHAGYTYTTVSGADVVVPDSEVILGYVNKAFEITGVVLLSGLSETASDLKERTDVGISPLPQFAQQCQLIIVDEDSLSFTCFVNSGWEGSVEIKTVSGAEPTYSPIGGKYIYSDTDIDADFSAVTDNVSGANFTVTP